MKILVMSDVHYPYSDRDDIKRIIGKEAPDKLMLTGDVIGERSSSSEFFGLIPKRLKKNTYFIEGDEDDVRGKYKIVRLKADGIRMVFVHGHQFNLGPEGFTAKIARLFGVLSRDLPLFAFCLYARLRLGLHDEYLFVGHSHGLRNFKSIKSVCCGTVSKLNGVYSDRGYVVIDGGSIRLERLS